MNILFAINEAAPVYKLGGLGDVGGSLPAALHHQQVDVRIIMPYHPEIKAPDAVEISRFHLLYDKKKREIVIFLTSLPDTTIPLYLIYESDYLHTTSDALDTYGDKYAVFSKAVVEWLMIENSWEPQIIHCHDWHTGLIPLLLKHTLPETQIKTILTIHNLGYQGIIKNPLIERLQLNPDICRILTWDRENNDINLLLEGILHADAVTTVSPTYAKEILTPQYGHQLEDILYTKRHNITGILNGIDIDRFNPAKDPHIDPQYTIESVALGKQQNKEKLATTYSLPVHLPMIGFVGRIDVYQKGIDIIEEYLYERHNLPPHTFIFIGTGDRTYETKLHTYGNKDNQVAIITRYDESLAQQIYASSDFLIIPSRYEPCGLIQMIAMRYGTIPIAHRTGGLADTIPPDRGLLYYPNTSAELTKSICEALKIYNEPTRMSSMRLQGMTTDFSWNLPVKEYINLYRKIINNETFN